MFTTIQKIFKALNSSGKSWQISGAIVLAMLNGFLPTTSLLHLDLLFLSLILNINFSIFLLFSVIFSGVGYIFDPWFESIGYALLTNDSLSSLFTYMYNSALWRWSAFNYTLVIGSIVVSLVLAFPMMFILNKFVAIYRVQIGQKLPFLFNEEVKKSSLFRWYGLGIFGGAFALIIVIFIFIFDPLAKFTLEKALSYSLKTEVYIKDFSTDFSALHVTINGLEVLDKDKTTHNLIQFNKLDFNLGLSALIQRKAFVKSLQVESLAFDERRRKTTKDYGDKTQQSSTASTKQATSSLISNPFSMPNVDDILSKEKLKSVEEVQALQADIDKTKKKWARIADELTKAGAINEIKKDAKHLQNIIKSGDIGKIVSAQDDLKKIQKKIKKLKAKYKNLNKEFKDDQKRIQKRVSSLKNLPKQDIARLKKKYSLDAHGGANIVGTLIDDKIGEYIKVALKYYDMIKPYMKKSADEDEIKEEVPPRGEGRWIRYANLSTLPSVVVKKATIGVKLKNDTLEMIVKNFSTNQKLYKKPMTLHVDASGSNYKSIVANAIDDRMSDEATTSFDIKISEFKIDKLDMQALSMDNISLNATANGLITEMNIDAVSEIDITKVQLKMGSQKLVNDILSNISSFGVNITLEGNIKKPSISIKSDLDNQLSKGLSSVAKKAAKGFEKKLTAGIMGKATNATSTLNTDIGDIDKLLGSNKGSLDGIDTNSKSTKGIGGLINKFF